MAHGGRDRKICVVFREKGEMMSIRLYTPATGLPDLEVKIAYGIARIGLEAFGEKKGEIFSIEDLGGHYEIEFFVDESEFDTLEKTINLVLKKVFSSFHVQRMTPGVTSKSQNNVTVYAGEEYSLNIYQKAFHRWANKSGENICKHAGSPIRNIIALSSATSYHNSRDFIDLQSYKTSKASYLQRSTDRKNICKTCGMLSLLGIWFATFVMNFGENKEVMIIPVPEGKIMSSDLRRIFSIQHLVRRDRISGKAPERVLPLLFFSRLPSSANVLEKFNLLITVLERAGGQGYRVDGFYTVPTSNYIEFINSSPFNIAIVDTMIRRMSAENVTLTSLLHLNSAVHYKNKKSASLFARQYVLETSSEGKVNLLYPETAKYFLRRVFMVKEEILNSTAVKSFAKTLGYFVWNKNYQNYSFADGIRNARTEKEMSEILQRLMREAKLRYDQESKEEQKGEGMQAERPHIPSAKDLEELNRLMKDSFEEVKAALYLLAFSYESHKKIYVGEDTNA